MIPSTSTPQEKHPAQKKKRFLPWRGVGEKPFAFALIALGLLIYYLTRVAPSLVPVPPGTKVPYPRATEVLEYVVDWCESHQGSVLWIGAGLLAAGFLRPLSAARYFVYVAVLSSLVLIFAYLSISAPVDRLFKAVQDNLPKDRRIPSYSETK